MNEKLLTLQDVIEFVENDDAFNREICDMVNMITETESYKKTQGMTIKNAVYYIYKYLKEHKKDYLLCAIIYDFLIHGLYKENSFTRPKRMKKGDKNGINKRRSKDC